ncbi:MAG: carboxymuconolactone decarboxylase family protein, partial [Roseinatronobacter sp.]|nr:carboxymuconolactone decarboxylase family protein [Roseinatronobacter sp.]
MSFAPLPDAQWPGQIADMRAGFAGQLNVYRVMAHHPALLRAWETLRTHIVQHSALGPERAEVGILRLAHRLGAAYEWNQHVVRGLRAGLDVARIRSLRGPCAQMSPEDALLAGAVDALQDHAQLAPDQMDALQALVGREGVLDLMATLGMYMTLGFILKSTNCPLEQDIAAQMATVPEDLPMPQAPD